LTTYTATLSGATDASGNVMTSVSWSFTVQGIWSQTSLSDFSAGTHSGTEATGQGGGALQLAAGFGDEFAGSALNTTAWGTGSWGTGSVIGVSSGVLSIQGSQVLSASTFSGKPLEGSINFGATPYQHFGFTTGFDSTSNYWAIFSTNGTSDTLFARVNANAQSIEDVNIGTLPSGFHTYRIEPISTGFKFYLDGTLKATINIAFPSNTQLRIGFSSYNGDPAPALKADWVRIAEYTTSGTYTSTVFDAGTVHTWQSASWTASVPSGTTLTIQIRISDDNSTWSDWTTVANGADLSSFSGRYFQYRVIFETTDPSLTAVLEAILFTYF
jgi:hypothetical protein